jgi:hypothetical protein
MIASPAQGSAFQPESGFAHEIFERVDNAFDEFLLDPTLNHPLEHEAFDPATQRMSPTTHSSISTDGIPQEILQDDFPQMPMYTMPETPTQRLLNVRAALQDISDTFKAGNQVLGNGTSTKTPIEKTFIVTEDLVTVVEDLYTEPMRGGAQRHDSQNHRHHIDGADSLHDNSTSLLVMSCYTCLLDIYRVLIASLYDQVDNTLCQRRDSYSSSRALTSTSSSTSLPTLSIGGFNLGCPTRNINLLLYATQEMIERLQDVVQSCSVTTTEQNVPGRGYGCEKVLLRARPSTIRGRRSTNTEYVEKLGVETAMTQMLACISNSIRSQEEQLMSSIQEVKYMLRGNS